MCNRVKYNRGERQGRRHKRLHRLLDSGASEDEISSDFPWSGATVGNSESFLKAKAQTGEKKPHAKRKKFHREGRTTHSGPCKQSKKFNKWIDRTLSNLKHWAKKCNIEWATNWRILTLELNPPEQPIQGRRPRHLAPAPPLHSSCVALALQNGLIVGFSLYGLFSFPQTDVSVLRGTLVAAVSAVLFTHGFSTPSGSRRLQPPEA